jgi:hypothetical protein
VAKADSNRENTGNVSLVILSMRASAWASQEGASNLHATAPEALLVDYGHAPKIATKDQLRLTIVEKVKLSRSAKRIAHRLELAYSAPRQEEVV